MDPETLYKRFRCAVLQLVDDNCYHARLGAITLVLDLYRLSTDMQVRSTCVISFVRSGTTPDILPGVHPLADRTREYAAGAEGLQRCHSPPEASQSGNSGKRLHRGAHGDRYSYSWYIPQNTTCLHHIAFDHLTAAAHMTLRFVDWQVRRRWSASNSSSMRCSCWSATPRSARGSAPSCRSCWSAWPAAWHTRPCHSIWPAMLRR